MTESQIKSPLDPAEEIILERDIEIQPIIDGYLKQYGVGVAEYFRSNGRIKLFRCLKSGYRFFFPFSNGGDSRFYEALARDPYYYLAEKWEYRAAVDWLHPGDKVLEVGCGRGSFLRKLSEKGIAVVGLELNEEAVKYCLGNKLAVYRQDLADHAGQNRNKYEAVCLFQVLEHIAQPLECLLSAIAALKPGGKLIISVPNNDGFIKNDPLNLLNLPPHHFGLWGKQSLESLAGILPVRLKSIRFEPLARYHVRYYFEVLIGNRLVRDHGIIGRFLRKLIILPCCLVIFLLSPWIKGHTIMAIYESR
jgi:2-polyprenyl-3-methyl-5-hydroxy-6-metoxy-1,4-benzoquinol methylase